MLLKKIDSSQDAGDGEKENNNTAIKKIGEKFPCSPTTLVFMFMF